MSISNLRKMKKDLMLIKTNSSKEKAVIQALDGLFLIDFKANMDNRDDRIKAIDKAPKGMNINTIGANIDDIFICGGFGEPMIIINDIDIADTPDIHTINIVPTFKGI